jgi:hypothetical protein
VLKESGYDFPLRKLIDSAGGATQTEDYLQEIFADVFAAFSCGPCVPAAFILLRFDPPTAHTDGREHPSHAKRVRAMFRTLKKMDADVGGLPAYGSIIARLKTRWEQDLAAVELPRHLEGQSQARSISRVDAWTDSIYQLIDEGLFTTARYDRWDRAKDLAARLHRDPDPQADLRSGDRLIDILNAAWLARVLWTDDSNDLRRIESVARGLALGLLGSSSGSTPVSTGKAG